MWVYQLQSGTMGPSTCSEGEMVNSCSAHLEGEWAEVVIQGVFLEERTLAEPRGGGDGKVGKHMQGVGMRLAH